MANRHLARSVVLQTLFEWDTAHIPAAEVAEVLKRNIDEFGGDDTDKPFMEQLLQGVIAKQQDLDLVIGKAAPDWPIERIAPVDRNILRIGLFELLFADRSQVPAKVAINEAIELAKVFGGDSSGRFVNGVLGAVYKEMGEPGKDETGKKDKVKREELPVEHLGGAIAYAEHEGQYFLALVHDVFGHWTLSKGRLADGEDIAEGTRRKILEEIGLEVSIEEKIGENEYIASHPEKGKYRKHVTYFLAKGNFEPLKLAEGKGGLDDVRWFRLTDILDLNFYDDMLPIVTEGVQQLLNKAQKKAGAAAR